MCLPRRLSKSAPAAQGGGMGIALSIERGWWLEGEGSFGRGLAGGSYGASNGSVGL
jgi:hypothetical protein